MAGRVRGILEHLLGRRLEAAVSDVVSDSELLRRFTATRDEAAFELLVWRYGAMVLGLCRRAIRDEQLAEDAFQAVFIVLARKAGSIRGGNVAGWLFRIARRVAARAAGRRRLTQPVPDVPAISQPSAAEHQELTEILDAEVARLPDRLRRAVILCYLGGHTTEDAARELGCPRGTVLSRLATARKRLAERLTRRGVTLPAIGVLVGDRTTGRLVSQTVALAQNPFRIPATTGPALLAESVVRSMATTKLAAICGAVLLTTGFTFGVGWVAAQSDPKQPVTVEPAATSQQKAQHQPAVPPKAEAQEDVKQRQNNLIMSLQVQHRKLLEQIHDLEEVMVKIRDAARKETLDNTVSLRHLQSVYETDRELALEDVRDAAKQVRAVRNQLLGVGPNAGAVPVDVLKKQLDSAEKELEKKRQAFRELDGQNLAAIEHLRGKTDSTSEWSRRQIMKHEEEITLARETMTEVRRQIVALNSQIDGLPPPAMGTDAKLDVVMRELGELRKEVRELRKPK